MELFVFIWLLFILDLLDVRTFGKVCSIKAHSSAINTISVAENTVITGSYDSCVKVWNINDLTPVISWEAEHGPKGILEISGTTRVTSASIDGKIIICSSGIDGTIVQRTLIM